MKRFIAGFLILLLLPWCSGCRKEEGEPAPEFFYYEVVYNGRRYTTDGCPYRFQAEDESSGFLAYKTNLLGVSDELEGSFPAGTRFYGIEGANVKVQILAVLENGLQHFLVSSFDTVTVSSGKSILNALGLENNCAYLYCYNEDKTRIRLLGLHSTELSAFSEAFAAGALTEPSGRSAELIGRAFTGEVSCFTLYENGAIVYAGCPQYAVDLGAEMNALLWRYIDGE